MSIDRNETGTGQQTGKRPRGFAAMSPEQRSELSRRGGKAAHSKGVAHRFTKDEAREAGRKGGLATHAKQAAAQAKS